MIAFLRGRPVNTGPDWVILDVAGIGYRVFVPPSVIQFLADKTAEPELTVHTYLHVREDAVQLFGFLQEDELALFEQLIQVSGVGPRLALAVLSAMPADSFIQAVRQEQVQVLTQIPGVGKKTAQRVIVELKDKFDKMNLGRETGAPGVSARLPAGAEDALQALVALGYNLAEARKALSKMAPAEISSFRPEEIVRLALKELGQFKRQSQRR